VAEGCEVSGKTYNDGAETVKKKGMDSEMTSRGLGTYAVYLRLSIMVRTTSSIVSVVYASCLPSSRCRWRSSTQVLLKDGGVFLISFSLLAPP
jgi:hypothetical protein